ncbi:MAG TPA: flagellar biosynthetic protein FliO [Dermatophilaceae bacterium]|nr:flagellar biosynthetic protein FliO [Dermatophilaceae bacterium]
MTDGSAVVLMLRMVLSLALVLGLVVAFSRGLQRRQGGRRPRRARRQPSAIEVVARHNLSRTASVQIVQVGERALLLGVSDAGIRLLGRLPDTSPESIDVDDLDALDDRRDDSQAGCGNLSYLSMAGLGADGVGHPQTRAERRRGSSPHPTAQQVTRAAARQADQVAQIIAQALGRVGRRLG